jgi:hypothetical protein
MNVPRFPRPYFIPGRRLPVNACALANARFLKLCDALATCRQRCEGRGICFGPRKAVGVGAPTKDSLHGRWNSAALRDFDPAYDRCGSFATGAVEATPRCMSAAPRKRTSDLRVGWSLDRDNKGPVFLLGGRVRGVPTFARRRSRRPVSSRGNPVSSLVCPRVDHLEGMTLQGA